MTLPEMIEHFQRVGEASDRARVTPIDFAGALTEIDRRFRVLEPCPVALGGEHQFGIGPECAACKVKR